MAFLVKENRICRIELQLFNSEVTWKHHAVPSNTHGHREEEVVALLVHDLFVVYTY